MSTSVYETAVIINAALDDEQIDQEIARLKESITNLGGEITEIENWGRKRLAYTVNKSKIGFYLIVRFNSSTNLISKLERYYVLNENILRFLTIKLEQNALEYFKEKVVPVQQEIPSAEEIKEQSLSNVTE